jgi:hypothetical protein
VDFMNKRRVTKPVYLGGVDSQARQEVIGQC